MLFCNNKYKYSEEELAGLKKEALEEFKWNTNGKSAMLGKSPNRVVVAPMAGITNSAFRVTVKEFGAGLVVCEMISDQRYPFQKQKTLRDAPH